MAKVTAAAVAAVGRVVVGGVVVVARGLGLVYRSTINGSSRDTETYKATTLFYAPDIDLRHDMIILH